VVHETPRHSTGGYMGRKLGESVIDLIVPFSGNVCLNSNID
jgi:hypothetical protein